MQLNTKINHLNEAKHFKEPESSRTGEIAPVLCSFLAVRAHTAFRDCAHA